MSIWVPITTAFINAIVLSLEKYLTKYALNNLKIDLYALTFARFFVLGVLGAFYSIIYFPLGTAFGRSFWYGVTTGTLFVLYKYFEAQSL